MTKAYCAKKVFTGETWLDDHLVLCENDIVRDVVPLHSYNGLITQVDADFLAPAFIDLQIYGAGGRLLAVYPDEQSLQTLVDYCYAGGAAFCLPTIATNTKEVIYRAIDAVRSNLDKGGKGILGLHLEGPWLNAEKRGAHIASLIHAPTVNEVKELIEYGKGVIRMITLAPEVCDNEIGQLLMKAGIVLSAGHSNATYEEAKTSFSSYVTTVTHLFNAMSPFTHRSPGLAGAAMDDDRVFASIIADGHHVDYAAIRIAKQVMKERLFVITDAVTETSEGHYQHYLVGDKYEAAGILSGSALTMNKGAQNLVQFAGVTIEEALRMCSLYPARVMGLDKELGQIAQGYKVSMVALDKNLNVKQLIFHT